MAIISDDSPVRRNFQLSGDIASLVISLIALPAITLLIYQRYYRVRSKRLTVAVFLCLWCYSVTFVFILAVTLVVHVRWPVSEQLCAASMIICLILHNLAKASEFIFLIERAYIISWPTRPRYTTPEYVISVIGILVPYLAVTILAIISRIAYILDTNICIIGMKRYALMPMLSVEAAAQLWLTIRFLLPLVLVHRNGGGLLLPLKKVAVRTAIGSAITLLLDVAVKVSLTLFNGEPVWLCYLTCKVEAFLATSILHWITKPILSDDAYHESKERALGIGFEPSDAPIWPKEENIKGSSAQVDIREALETRLDAGMNAVRRDVAGR